MISGQYVALRAIERDDLADLLAWRNNPHFRRYFREFRELSMADQERWYDEIVLKDPSVRMFSIIEKDSKRLIGACGLCYIDHRNQSADFSIYIGKDELYIDDCLAPDAGLTLLRYGFSEMNLHRIWAEIYSTDEPKQALFNTLGLTLEGRHRQTRWVGGSWVDSLFYGLLKDEFAAR